MFPILRPIDGKDFKNVRFATTSFVSVDASVFEELLEIELPLEYMSWVASVVVVVVVHASVEVFFDSPQPLFTTVIGADCFSWFDLQTIRLKKTEQFSSDSLETVRTYFRPINIQKKNNSEAFGIIF